MVALIVKGRGAPLVEGTTPFADPKRMAQTVTLPIDSVVEYVVNSYPTKISALKILIHILNVKSVTCFYQFTVNSQRDTTCIPTCAF